MGINVRRLADETTLEQELLRQGVSSRGVDEARCVDCGRVPLIGESVATYAGERIRCELCRTVSREAATGERLVKHAPDGPRSRVRVLRRLPA